MEEKFMNAFKEALEMEDQEIALTDKFRDFDEWDSLSRLSLIAMLDEEYGTQIEEGEFDKLITVGDIFNAVKSF